MSLPTLLFFKIILASGTLKIPYKFEDLLFTSVGILMRIALNLQITLSIIDILIILGLPVHEHIF